MTVDLPTVWAEGVTTHDLNLLHTARKVIAIIMLLDRLWKHLNKVEQEVVRFRTTCVLSCVCLLETKNRHFTRYLGMVHWNSWKFRATVQPFSNSYHEVKVIVSSYYFVQHYRRPLHRSQFMKLRHWCMWAWSPKDLGYAGLAAVLAMMLILM